VIVAIAICGATAIAAIVYIAAWLFPARRDDA
jgi:phage shock protein PspC (stress-responsive transcriptional regulator)